MLVVVVREFEEVLLVTENARWIYRFYLTADGKVADFSSEQR